ncbi:MAG: glycosyltransferase [Candidatus Omnitrophica bacterium]|nr:glycosyltransferase [Candidatus Omnitrophota bacterium]
MKPQRLVFVVNPDISHVGFHFKQAAEDLNIDFKICDMSEAFRGPSVLNKINWHLLGHRPAKLSDFSRRLLAICNDYRPDTIISTGLAPLEMDIIKEIGEIGIRRINYLTDDPFNSAHKAGWFMKGLPFYDVIFSPRRSNIEDLKKTGCKKVEYLQFGYNPYVHYPEAPSAAAEFLKFETDMVFIGGADRDRLPFIKAVINSGIKIAIYGGYWEKNPYTMVYSQGLAAPEVMRKAIGGAKVALCLVRRANRDGHSMRTFEIPAMGGCMLAEDTEEHREIFGSDGEYVIYFRTPDEMVHKAQFLISNEKERRRLAEACHSLIIKKNNTYKDRLVTMLNA